MSLSTVIFDFDGTLHDSLHVYTIAFRRAYAWLVEEGWAEPQSFSSEDLSGYIGLTAEEMWTSFRPDLPTAVWQQAAARVGTSIDELIAQGEARLFPGVPAMLARIKANGFKLVFLSNCRIAYQEEARRTFGLDAWFDGYFNSEEFGGIPKEEIFESIAAAFPMGFAVVGDRAKDLAVARVHDLPSVGCLYGYGSAEELADATYLARSPEDIVDFIERIARAS